MSYHFYTRAMAEKNLGKIDYMRGWRYNLSRINVHRAGLEAKEPYDYTELVEVKTGGKEVIPSGTDKITAQSTLKTKPRAIDFGPKQPEEWDTEEDDVELSSKTVEGVHLVLDLADQQFTLEFMKAAKLLIRVSRQHIERKAPRIKEYWDKEPHLDGVDPNGFNWLTPSRYDLVSGLYI